MKYHLKILSKPVQAVEEKHSKFTTSIMKCDPNWRLQEREYPLSEMGGELLVLFPLGTFLGQGIKGDILYRYRGGLQETSEYDDAIDLEFKSNRADLQSVVLEVFPFYCQAFDAYYGHVGNEEYLYADFERWRRVDQRRGIVRVYEVNYFSWEHFTQLSNNNPNMLVSRLQELGMLVSELDSGLVIRSAQSPLSYEQGDELNAATIGAFDAALQSR